MSNVPAWLGAAVHVPVRRRLTNIGPSLRHVSSSRDCFSRRASASERRGRRWAHAELEKDSMEEPRTPPSLDEPTTPQEPMEPLPDQQATEVVSATGKPTGAPYRGGPVSAQEPRCGLPPALSQVGTPYPVDGRKIGVVVDAMSESGLAAAVVDAVREARMMPFVVGIHGGMVDELTVARTYATARSYEFDALVVVGAAPAPDALPGLDARAGEPHAEPVAQRGRWPSTRASPWSSVRCGGTARSWSPGVTQEPAPSTRPGSPRGHRVWSSSRGASSRGRRRRAARAAPRVEPLHPGLRLRHGVDRCPPSWTTTGPPPHGAAAAPRVRSQVSG